MKKCEHFRDSILTDYIDGELNKESRSILENHLLDCKECRVFLKEVKNIAALPLQDAGNQPVPAVLWDSIKQSIEDENQSTSPLENFIEKIKDWMVFPRLVPVFASLIIMLLAGSVTLNTIQIQQDKDKQQGEYLVSLLSPASSSSSESNDPGTPIEHYFL